MINNTPSGKLSLGSFNFIKGVAICVIILGHISLEFDIAKLSWFYPLFFLLDFLKTPFMPLFFIISGYTFKKRSMASLLKKTTQSLLVPYGIVMVVFAILQPLLMYMRSNNYTDAINNCISVTLAFLLGLPTPGKMLFGYKLYHCAIVWFLLAAFWGYNILNCILLQRRISVQILLVIACASLGYLLFQRNFYYFCIPHGLIAATYFYVGYFLKKTKLLERGLPHKWMYAVLTVIAVVYAFHGEFDLCYGKFAFFPMDYVGVIFLALLLLFVGIEIGNLDWKIFDAVHTVGAYSYWVLCIHSIEQKCLPWREFIQLTQSNPNLGFLLALIVKALIIIFCCKMIKYVSKRKYRKHKKYYEQQNLYTGLN